jgi:hypothetical protein
MSAQAAASGPPTIRLPDYRQYQSPGSPQKTTAYLPSVPSASHLLLPLPLPLPLPLTSSSLLSPASPATPLPHRVRNPAAPVCSPRRRRRSETGLHSHAQSFAHIFLTSYHRPLSTPSLLDTRLPAASQLPLTHPPSQGSIA